MTDNVQSIRAIPASVITIEDRAAYLARAEAGEEVYAYESGPGTGHWNIFDIDTRIVLPPLAKVWHIASATEVAPELWQVNLARPFAERAFTIWIAHHPEYAPDATRYPAYARRRMLDLVNHCAMFDIDPATLQGTHH
jgi:hypothetical protein